MAGAAWAGAVPVIWPVPPTSATTCDTDDAATAVCPVWSTATIMATRGARPLVDARGGHRRVHELPTAKGSGYRNPMITTPDGWPPRPQTPRGAGPPSPGLLQPVVVVVVVTRVRGGRVCRSPRLHTGPPPHPLPWAPPPHCPRYIRATPPGSVHLMCYSRVCVCAAFFVHISLLSNPLHAWFLFACPVSMVAFSG